MRTNKENNTEHQGDISKMLAALPRADAPASFEHRVNARIAEGKPRSQNLFSFLPVMKVAIPAILLMVMGAYLLLPVLQPSGDGEARISDHQPAPSLNEPPIGTTSFIEDDRKDTAVKEEPANAGDEKSSEPEVAVKNQSRDSSAPKRGIGPPITEGPSETEPEREPDGGSTVRTTTRPQEKNVNAPGLTGDVTDPRSFPGFANTDEVKVTEIFKLIGVKADFGPEGWKVSNVDSAGAGRRSGIRSGDVIEAFDGIPLKRDTTFKGNVNLRTVRVKRGDESLDIPLQN